jgi:hypothetical protein
MILGGLGDAALLLGDAERAAQYHREALARAEDLGLSLMTVGAIAALAAVAALDGDAARAATLWGAAEALSAGGTFWHPHEHARHERYLRNLDPELVEQGRRLDRAAAVRLALSLD